MITIVSGTNREGSNSLKIVDEVAGYYRELNAEVDIMDLKNLPPEILDPGVYGDKPDTFKPFIQRILDSDGLALIIPEYNGSFPGILKFFIDLLPFPESFDQRPVCYIGISAGQFGGLRPVEQMQMIFGYRNAYNFPVRTFIPAVGKILDSDGKLADPDLVKRLKKQASGFLDFVGRLKKE